MDYYRMRNVIADTDMRDGIAKATTPTQPAAPKDEKKEVSRLRQEAGPRFLPFPSEVNTLDIFSVVILAGVAATVYNMIRKASQVVKKAQNNASAQPQSAAEAPAPKPVPKTNDFRFPSVIQPATKPVLPEEGRNPDAVVTTGVYSDLRDYTPIAPSKDLNNQFTQYQGSLGAATNEGSGYQPEEYEPSAAAYQTVAKADVQILPERLTRDALLQAVVMSEILKRPGDRQ